MRWFCVVALIGAVGCDEETLPVINVVIDRNEIVVERLAIIWADRRYDTTDGPTTPELIARGESAPPIADVWNWEFSRPRDAFIDNPGGVETWRMDWREGGSWRSHLLVLALGQIRDDTGSWSTVAGGRIAVEEQELPDGDLFEDSTLTREVVMETADAEEWGKWRCLRFEAHGMTSYIVHENERDCDDQLDASDCQPLLYCDPSVPSTCACP